MPLWIKDENGLPDGPHSLVIARPALKPNEVKFFLSNASLDTPVETLLPVAFSRWYIEWRFEDTKTELGLDHFEVRRYGAITRHLLLTCVSHLLLAEFVQQRKNDADLTVCPVRTATRRLVPLWLRGGRCSRPTAECLAAQLTFTPQHNAAAARSHRKRTLRRLRAIGIRLRALRICHWPRKERCSTSQLHFHARTPG